MQFDTFPAGFILPRSLSLQNVGRLLFGVWVLAWGACSAQSLDQWLGKKPIQNSTEGVRYEWAASAASTVHWNRSEEHKPIFLIGYERHESSDQSFSGAAFFTNSFGQPTVYLYPFGGKYADLAGVKGWYAKWSAGLLYGYRGKHQDKVPFNYRGFSPGLILSTGYQFQGGALKDYSVQANLLGTAGVMMTLHKTWDIK